MLELFIVEFLLLVVVIGAGLGLEGLYFVAYLQMQLKKIQKKKKKNYTILVISSHHFQER